MQHININQFLVYVVVCFSAIYMPSQSTAYEDNELPWSMSFVGPEWSGPQASPSVITPGFSYGIDRWANQEIDDPGCSSPCIDGAWWDAILETANYPLGGGGNGIVQYVEGSSIYVQPRATGAKLATFADGQTELWIRFMISYEPGFSFLTDDSTGQKMIYLVRDSNLSAIFAVNITYDTFRTHGLHISETGTGFNTLFGANLTQSWHMVEVHLKSETVTEAPFDGVVQMWADGVLIMDFHDTDLGIVSVGEEFGGLQLQSNYHDLPDFTPKGFYMDDIIIYGTVSETATTPPNFCDDGEGGETYECIGDEGLNSTGGQPVSIGTGESITIGAGESVTLY